MLEAVRLDANAHDVRRAAHLHQRRKLPCWGKDATLMRRLANQRYLSSKDISVPATRRWSCSRFGAMTAGRTPAPTTPLPHDYQRLACVQPSGLPEGGLLGARLFSKWCATPSPLLRCEGWAEI